MKKLNNPHIPEYVYQYVKIHTARLLRCQYFRSYEKEDIAQELLLFYLEKFGFESNFEAEFVFVAIKNKALNMLKERANMKRNYSANTSLDEILETGYEYAADDIYPSFERDMSLREAISSLNAKDQKICLMILGGATLEQVTREFHISKHTIYKVFEILKKYFSS